MSFKRIDMQNSFHGTLVTVDGKSLVKKESNHSLIARLAFLITARKL